MSEPVTQPVPLGVLVVGHGTRDERGQGEFATTVQLVADRLSEWPVEAGCLELADPTIATGWDRLVLRGARRIIVSPLLLFAAGHARQDIPAAVSAAARRHSGIEWLQAQHLGCHPALVQLAARRFQEARTAAATQPRAHLLAIGRGSRDHDATLEMRQFVRLLSEQVQPDGSAIGFVAMAKPTMEEAFAAAAESTSATIVVQPHLLFHGELLREIQQRVDAWQRRTRHDWRIAHHLGPDERVVETVADRCRAVAEQWS